MRRNCWKCDEEFDRSEMEEHHLIPENLFYDKQLADRFRILLCEDCHKETTKEFVEDDVVWIPGPKNLVVKNG